nr:soluble guanylate cyclase gcy [Hymenolepis microstoma]
MLSLIQRLSKIDCSFFKLVTPISRLSSSTKPTPKSSDTSLSNPFDDVYACGVRSGELARDPLALARFLASRVVAYGRHFLVIDKPANLSVYGHALSASPFISGATPQSPPLSVYECLPHLRDLLSELSPFSLNNSSDTSHSISVLVAEKRKKVSKRPFSDAWTPPSEIFIVEPLPAAYSGLILLSTSKSYADFARSFYRDATKNTFPGSMYQTFHVACWGLPSRNHVENERFPIAVHKASESISVAYRPTDDKITSTASKKGALLFKHIGHRMLSGGSSQDSGSIIELVCNSCYAGLPEVYLLHEGCEVIGEDLQASRLVKNAGIPMVLPPAMAKLGAPIPTEQLKIFGVKNLPRAAIPTHIHRSQLLLPIPLSTSFKAEVFSRRHQSSLGRIFSTHENLPILSWKTYPAGEEKNVCFLSAISSSLPSYFVQTLEKLGLSTEYPLKTLTE